MTNTNLKLIETHYDEEKTKVNERYYVDKNDLRQGLYESFYKSGQLFERCTYKNDKREGLFEWFHENNQLSQRGTYKNDDLHGILELFDNQGKFEFSCNYYTK